MNAHNLLSVINCVGDLALVFLAWSRRSRSAIATPMLVLFLAMFAWGFADLQHELFAVGRLPAHVLASFLPALSLQVVVVFVGKARSSRRRMQLAYAATLVVAMSAPWTEPWWQLLLGLAVVLMGYSVVLLLEHRRRAFDVEERARADLILLAVFIGTVVGTTDLWYNEVSFPVPRLSNLGTLMSMVLFAVAALRMSLLGNGVPIVFGVLALFAGVLWMIAYLATLYWLDRRSGLIALSAVTGLMVAALAWREFRRSAAAARERVQRLAGLGRLAEQLAHDLKNPLAALKGGLQFLAVELQQGRSLDTRNGYLQLMLEQVDRVNRVVEEYQRIARVEPVRSRSRVNDIVSGVLGLQSFASSGSVTLTVELAESLPDCLLDPELIGMALENILRNAYEAMPAGGKVVVKTQPAFDADAVLITVEDQGQGMDARELERAADEFFTTKADGTGLGLYFVARVAHVHGGRLNLNSTVGQGTRVGLWLPAFVE
jgi:two-component system, NtrC family, sensor histidine kinase HydH